MVMSEQMQVQQGGSVVGVLAPSVGGGGGHHPRVGVVQPSLVMNPLSQVDNANNTNNEKLSRGSFHHHHHLHSIHHPIQLHHNSNLHGGPNQRQSHCVGCGGQIHDQYILRVAPDLEWHAACLKCQQCQMFLDENCTCFVRDGKTYCKQDYVRLFGTKCCKCGHSFTKTDFVMRAKTKIYHIECFRCSACHRQLVPGDEFALRDGGSLYCKDDHDVMEQSHSRDSKKDVGIVVPNSAGGSAPGTPIAGSGGPTDNNNTSSVNNNNHNSNSSELGCMSDSGSESGSHKGSTTPSGDIRPGRKSSSASGNNPGGGDGKPTRVRTVLNEKQLHTLRTCYAANPRPDALMKEQLVEMTSLSPRVIRVWFQNKRCKDKKKTILMKQQMQQEKFFAQDGRKLGYGSMQGIPMVASSPVRHDSPLGVHPLEVQAYQPPWKALSDFALHSDLEQSPHNMGGLVGHHGGPPPPPPHSMAHSPAFQQLVNQMHGYDLPHCHPPANLGGGGGGVDGLGHPDSADSYVTYLDNSDDSLPPTP